VPRLALLIEVDQPAIVRVGAFPDMTLVASLHLPCSLSVSLLLSDEPALQCSVGLKKSQPLPLTRQAAV